MSSYRPYHYVETDSKPERMGHGFFIMLGLCIFLLIGFFWLFSYRNGVIQAYESSVYYPLEQQEEVKTLRDNQIVVLGTNYLNQGRVHGEALHYAALITIDDHYQLKVEELSVEEALFSDRTLKDFYQTDEWQEAIQEEFNLPSFYTVHLSFIEIRPLIEAIGGLEMDGRRWSDLELMEYMYGVDEEEQMKREHQIVHHLVNQVASYKSVFQLQQLLQKSTHFIETDLPYPLLEKTLIHNKLYQVKERVLSLFNKETNLFILK